MESWDYIIVGAGHNGLSAGCTLAMAGRKVLLVDQLDWVGGLSASLPWVPEAPNHLLSVGAMDDMLMAQTSLTSDLGLERYGYEPVPLTAPYGWLGENGETLLLFRDFERTLQDIRKFSAEDAGTYAEIKPTLDIVMDLTSTSARPGPGDRPQTAAEGGAEARSRPGGSQAPWPDGDAERLRVINERSSPMRCGASGATGRAWSGRPISTAPACT